MFTSSLLLRKTQWFLSKFVICVFEQNKKSFDFGEQIFIWKRSILALCFISPLLQHPTLFVSYNLISPPSSLNFYFGWRRNQRDFTLIFFKLISVDHLEDKKLIVILKSFISYILWNNLLKIWIHCKFHVRNEKLEVILSVTIRCRYYLKITRLIAVQVNNISKCHFEYLNDFIIWQLIYQQKDLNGSRNQAHNKTFLSSSWRSISF